MAFLPAIGAAVSAFGTLASGVAANRAAQQDALNAEAAGMEERAAGQREAEQKRREGQLVLSRQQALAAASGAGAGADAPTLVKIMTDTAQAAELNAQQSLFVGEQRQRGYNQQARARRAEGRASLLGGVLGGFGQAASGIGDAYRSGASSGGRSYG